MPSTRRRILRRAVIVLTVMALLIALIMAFQKPDDTPYIERSRAIRVGMTYAEVIAVMGADKAECQLNGATIYSFGSATLEKHRRWDRFIKRVGLVPTGPSIDAFPVHVRFDKVGRVDRIERGDQIEESPSR